MSKEHVLKIQPEFFNAVLRDEKTFEVRKNDRDFKAGDTLRLREYNPEIDSYSGKEIFAWISYIMQGGSFGIDPEYCVLSIVVAGDFDPKEDQL